MAHDAQSAQFSSTMDMLRKLNTAKITTKGRLDDILEGRIEDKDGKLLAKEYEDMEKAYEEAQNLPDDSDSEPDSEQKSSEKNPRKKRSMESTDHGPRRYMPIDRLEEPIYRMVDGNPNMVVVFGEGLEGILRRGRHLNQLTREMEEAARRHGPVPEPFTAEQLTEMCKVKYALQPTPPQPEIQYGQTPSIRDFQKRLTPLPKALEDHYRRISISIGDTTESDSTAPRLGVVDEQSLSRDDPDSELTDSIRANGEEFSQASEEEKTCRL